MDACEPAGLRQKSTRTFGCYYAIVNENPSDPEDDNWDPEQTLVRAVTFSRIIHPNPTGFTYAARIRRDQSKELIDVISARSNAGAYVGNTERAYLTADEWKEVGDLLNQWEDSVARTSARIDTSLWLFEKAAREHYLEARWPLTAAAVEALVHSEKKCNSSKWRFKRLLIRLGESSGHPFTEKQGDDAWDYRCTLVHGGRPHPLSSEQGTERVQLLARIEQSLGSFLEAVINDDSSASTFNNEDDIMRWLDP